MYAYIYGYRRRSRPLHVRAWHDPLSSPRVVRAFAVAFFPAVAAILLLSVLHTAVVDLVRELGRFVLTEQRRR